MEDLRSKYDTVNNYHLESDQYLFLDIFCRNNELVIISPTYNSEQIDSLVINYQKDVLKRKAKHDSGRMFVLLYEININDDREIDVEVCFNNTVTAYRLQHLIITEKQYKLAQTTLFKNDVFLVPKFLKYYQKQGVEHFYFYYNGNISGLTDKKIISQNDAITLIEWDYAYYSDGNAHGASHAQAGQLNHSLYKYGKVNTTYMLYNDLDEYLYLPATNLIDFIGDQEKMNAGIDTFMFLHKWADTIKIPTNTGVYFDELERNDNLPGKFYVDEYTFPVNFRSKCIHKTDSIYLLVNPHLSDFYTSSKNIYSKDLVFFHFFRWAPPHIDHGMREREHMKIKKMEIVELNPVDKAIILIGDIIELKDFSKLLEQTIKFYLDATNIKIVVANNLTLQQSLSSIFTDAVKTGRLEIISIDDSLTKKNERNGIKMLDSLEQVFLKSKIISETNYVYIINGWLKVLNISEITSEPLELEEDLIKATLYDNLSFADDRCWGAPVNFYLQFLLPYKNILKSNSNIDFSYILAKAVHLAMANNNRLLYWSPLPRFSGLEETSGKEYNDSMLLWNIENARQKKRRLLLEDKVKIFIKGAGANRRKLFIKQKIRKLFTMMRIRIPKRK